MIIFEDNSIEIWDIEKFKRARQFKLSAQIKEAFFSADNKFVFVASADKSLTIFDILSGK